MSERKRHFGVDQGLWLRSITALATSARLPKKALAIFHAQQKAERYERVDLPPEGTPLPRGSSLPSKMDSLVVCGGAYIAQVGRILSMAEKRWSGRVAGKRTAALRRIAR
jgi:hypothetical protein